MRMGCSNLTNYYVIDGDGVGSWWKEDSEMCEDQGENRASYWKTAIFVVGRRG